MHNQPKRQLGLPHSKSNPSILRVLGVLVVRLAFLLLDQVLNIGESDSLLVHSNVLEEISKITPSSFINVSEYTILILSIVLEVGISLDFVVDLVSENMLISKKVSNLVL